MTEKKESLEDMLEGLRRRTEESNDGNDTRENPAYGDNILQDNTLFRNPFFQNPIFNSHSRETGSIDDPSEDLSRTSGDAERALADLEKQEHEIKEKRQKADELFQIAKKTWFSFRRIRKYEEVLEIDRGHLGALEELAKEYEYNGKFGEACAKFVHFGKKKGWSEKSIASYLFKRAYNADNAVLEGVYYEKVTKLNPDEPAALFNLGLVHERIEDYEKASGFFERYVSKKPSEGPLTSLLFKRATKSKNNRLKKGYYSIILRRDPEHAASLNNMGAVYSEEGDISKAVNFYKKAIDADPEDYLYHQNLGNVYLKQSLFGKAAAEFRKAIELDPVESVAHEKLGKLEILAPHIGLGRVPLSELANIAEDHLKSLRYTMAGEVVWTFKDQTDNHDNYILRFHGISPSPNSETVKPAIYDVKLSKEGDLISDKKIQEGIYQGS